MEACPTTENAATETGGGESMVLDDDMIADQIRSEMREVRRELRGNIESIATQARQLTDWKYYVQQTPWLAVSLAALAGFSAVPSRAKSATTGVATKSKLNDNVAADRPVDSVSNAQAGGDGLAGFAKRLIVAGLTRSVVNYVAGQVAQIVDSSARANHSTPKYTSTNGRDTI